jgi:hypothetical protein
VVRFSVPKSPLLAAVPAPRPASQNVYMVFLDWIAYNITPVGMQVIGRAADQYK